MSEVMRSNPSPRPTGPSNNVETPSELLIFGDVVRTRAELTGVLGPVSDALLRGVDKGILQ